MEKMCKKVVSLLLAAVMVLTMTAFASVVYAADEDSVEADPNFKMGVILVGDETEGYSAAHIAGVKEAAAELGLDESQIIWKYKVPEDSSCYDAAIDLVGQGCSLVIGNSTSDLSGTGCSGIPGCNIRFHDRRFCSNQWMREFQECINQHL